MRAAEIIERDRASDARPITYFRLMIKSFYAIINK